ncbi:hypothetical protein [Bacillus phage 1_ICo-2020]|uniref:Uncharacterized protein n=1 Tax=Bacillus phage 1_ICo-2020 TaxID=2759272 RepID=A0A7G8AKH1_9CAUD|nr:hypothetical protein [Bacillus phage 1_ICo-2020]
MTEQMNIFDHYHSEEVIPSKLVQALEGIGFSYILPLGASKQGHSAFRGEFEGKSCTVNVDADNHVMIKHDNNRFWDYIQEVKYDDR